MTWTNQSKNTSSFNNQSKNASIWDMEGTDLLLLENGYRLLLETGFSIVLEQSGSISSTWINEAKH